jgi:hypothetical protein
MPVLLVAYKIVKLVKQLINVLLAHLPSILMQTHAPHVLTLTATHVLQQINAQLV